MIERLRAVVEVVDDAEVRAGYETDWTGRWRGSASAVVRPVDAAQTAAVLALGAPVVPQGGNTGLVGGAVPRDGAVLLSTERMTTVRVDVDAGQLEAGAGVTLAAAQAAASAAGWRLPLDLGARDSATVGGVLACNAGGSRAFRFGTARALVAGVEAVLPGGGVVERMSGLLKDNAGYDLASLLVGSEGTLGVITRARLTLVPARREPLVAALVALPGAAAAVALAGELRRSVADLEALELVCAQDGATLLCEGGRALLDALAAGHPDAAVADDTTGREGLWRERESLTERLAGQRPLKLDVALPLAAIGAFVDGLPALLAGRGRPVVWGHAGDGNLHVNVVEHDPGDEHAITGDVLRAVVARGGSVGAEHGIGVAKRQWLSLTRSAVDIAAMRAVKRALDPDGLLNPGVLLP